MARWDGCAGGDREAAARESSKALILCGHTHIARAVRLRDGRLIVNPGSVGSPGYRDTHPYPHVVEAGTPRCALCYPRIARWRWQVTFRHVPYDHGSMADLARRNGQPEFANALATGWIGPAKTKTAGERRPFRTFADREADQTAAEIHCCSFAFGAAPT